jgi:putative NADPH-quinone reductase
MGKRILLLQGHPDRCEDHLCHALAHAYAGAARLAGHEVRQLTVAQLDFPLLRSQHEWEEGVLPDGLRAAQADIAWSQHLVLFFPLWLGDMPALLKGFLEQVARPGFAFKAAGGNAQGRKGLRGRSARVVVTMGMPALVYRWFFWAHSVKSLERNILKFVGFAPVSTSYFGLAGNPSTEKVAGWVGEMEKLGHLAA